jgi:hypothetical protein
MSATQILAADTTVTCGVSSPLCARSCRRSSPIWGVALHRSAITGRYVRASTAKSATPRRPSPRARAGASGADNPDGLGPSGRQPTATGGAKPPPAAGSPFRRQRSRGSVPAYGRPAPGESGRCGPSHPPRVLGAPTPPASAEPDPTAGQGARWTSGALWADAPAVDAGGAHALQARGRAAPAGPIPGPPPQHGVPGRPDRSGRAHACGLCGDRRRRLRG